jgi:HD-like signal output (HDOD) protein
MSWPQRRSPNYGRGVHRIDDEPSSQSLRPTVDVEALKLQLLELFRSAEYRPPMLPAVALELLALTRMPDVNVAKVVALLSQDPMLAGQLLRLARSAAYSRGEALRSLEEAVVRLGLSRVGDLFLQVALETKVFRAPGFAEPMARLRRHSAFTAEAARIVCQETCGLDDSAFLCGLLHDAGIAACILALSGPLKGAASGGFEEAWPSVRPIHASTSEMLARVWCLPPELTLALRLHHDPSEQGRVHPVAAAIHYADCVSEAMGCGFDGLAHAGEREEAARALGLAPAKVARLDVALQGLAQSLGA